MEKLLPLYDKIIVKIIKEKNINNIIITNTKFKNFNQGIIISVGEGILLQNGKILPLKVKKNDKIIFSKDNFNIKIENINNEEVAIMSENDVLAIVNN